MDQDDLKERRRRKRLEVVAYGCHERARSDIQKKLRKITSRDEPFLLIEYFCDQPVAINDADSEWNMRRVYYPYIRRIIEENQFIWISKDNDLGEFSLQPRSSDHVHKLEEEEFLTRTQYAQFGRRIFRGWVDKNEPGDCITNRMTPDRWEAYKTSILEYPTEDRRQLLKEYGLAARSWVECDTDCLLMGFPLATDAVFYGYLILVVSAPAKKDKDQELTNELRQLLPKLAESTYLPVLTILYESFLEEELKDKLEPYDRDDKDPKGWRSEANNFLRDLTIFGCSVSEDDNHEECPNKFRRFDKMERALHKVWIGRKKILDVCSDSANDLFRFRETLLFERYAVASPGVMEELGKVMTSSFRKPTVAGGALPAALVFGGPGSGKDTLARMIPLFSEDYLYDSKTGTPVETYIINMASLRPPAITGPLFQGISVVRPGESRQAGQHPYNLEGLLVQAKRAPATGLKKSDSDVEKGKKERRAAFILDELNSLDIDLQGILLRIIENGEVTPLGDLEKDLVEHLIIGVVNEKPEEITREREIKELLGEQGRLGSVISGCLYEMMRGTRRLREDLYHRLKRKLYIKIPDLKDRLEDIPILFYTFVSQQEKRARVELKGYKLLMDPRFRWPGNVRELQSVVERVIRKLNKPSVSSAPASGEQEIIVTYDIILSVLSEEFPEALRQDGETQE